MRVIGMWVGVAVGWIFGVILAASLHAFDATPQTVERIAFTVSVPVILACGAIGGLIGYRRDQR